jgi:hypothetical protein
MASLLAVDWNCKPPQFDLILFLTSLIILLNIAQDTVNLVLDGK